MSLVMLTIFAFSAILYIDDTDLLMRALLPTTPDTAFFNMIQKSLSDWVALVMATGGSIKQKKSYVRVKSCCFKTGKARLKKIRNLPRRQFTIPQKDGESAIVPLLESDTAKKTLGVLTNTTGTSNDHVQKIKKTGLSWIRNLKPNKCVKPADGWLSFEIQL